MNRTGRTVVGVQVRLKREDVGLVVGAVAAVALIGGFLIATSGSSEEADAGPTTTTTTTAVPERRPGLVRVESDIDPELEWANAQGAFRPECAEGRVVHLDAKVSRLPTDLRYAWRILTDEATLATAPLARRPNVGAELIQGDGVASAFRTTPTGKATVRFTFGVPRRDVIVDLALTVLDVPDDEAFVLASPDLTCRGTA